MSTMTGRQRLQSSWTARPIWDAAFAAVLGIIAYFVTPIDALLGDGAIIDTHEFVIGVATLAGLVFAAASFICTMTYTSKGRLVAHIREKYRSTLSSNWVSVIASTLSGGVVATVLIAFPASRFMFALSVACLSLVAASGYRSIWWLKTTLFLNDWSAPYGEAIPPKDRTFVVD